MLSTAPARRFGTAPDHRLYVGIAWRVGGRNQRAQERVCSRRVPGAGQGRGGMGCQLRGGAPCRQVTHQPAPGGGRVGAELLLVLFRLQGHRAGRWSARYGRRGLDGSWTPPPLQPRPGALAAGQAGCRALPLPCPRTAAEAGSIRSCPASGSPHSAVGSASQPLPGRHTSHLTDPSVATAQVVCMVATPGGGDKLGGSAAAAAVAPSSGPARRSGSGASWVGLARVGWQTGQAGQGGACCASPMPLLLKPSTQPQTGARPHTWQLHGGTLIGHQ